MATQTIEFRSPPSQTVTAKLFAVGSDTQVDSQSATEATNRKGTYAAAYTDVAAGEYELIAFVGAVPVSRWFVTLTLTTATFQVYDKAKTELIATNAVNAASLATDAVAEIQSGLATATNVSDAQTAIITQVDANETKIDSIQSDTNDIQTRLPAALESGRIAAALDSAAINAVADAVLTESILDHRNVANSLAKYIWQIRQANLTIDGTVSNAITPTTLTFASNVVATTSAYAHAVLLFTTGPLAGENSPIISYNSTNGVFLLEEALTAAPSNGDEFVVIAGSHVHSVADIQSGLATSAGLAAAKTILDKVDTGLVVDGAVYQFTANMLELGPSGGGGGDATLANQVEIKALLTGNPVIQVASPNVSGNLVLTQGDDYDGTANPRAQWTVTTDYTDGWSVTLTIRDADDAVIYTTAGTVVSSTVIAVTIAAPTGLTMTGCPGQWQGKFDVQLTKAGKKKTIALGVCYINEDQTR